MYTVTPRNALRYRLHHRIRKQGFTLATRERTIYHSHSKPLPESKDLTRLIKEFGYVVQIVID